MYENIVKLGQAVLCTKSHKQALIDKMSHLERDISDLTSEEFTCDFPLQWGEMIDHSLNGQCGTYVQVRATGSGSIPNFIVRAFFKNDSENNISLSPLTQFQQDHLRLHALEKTLELLRYNRKKD